MDVEVRERVDDHDFDKYAETSIQNAQFFFIKLGDWKRRMKYSDELLMPLKHLDGEMKKMALRVFDLIGKICKNRKNQDQGHLPTENIRKLIELLLNNPSEIKDECFLQLIKQTTDNPHATRTLNEWKLLAIISSFVSPSEDFIYAFINKMESVYDQTISDDVKQWTKFIVKRVLQTNETSERLVLPCVEELNSIEDRRKIAVEVFFPNGSSEVFFIESYSTLEELKDEIVEKYQFVAEKKSHYGFYEYCSKNEINEENFIDDTIKIMDVLGSWANEKDFLDSRKTDEQKREDEENGQKQMQFRLYFFIRFFFDSPCPAHRVLMYQQCEFQFMRNRFHLDYQTWMSLLGLRWRVAFGDCSSTVEE